jgi:hypothetical protein
MRKSVLVAVGVVLSSSLVGSFVEADMLPLGGTFKCKGKPMGSENAVRVNCTQEVPRGNRIFYNYLQFDVRGPIARRYVGTHAECELYKWNGPEGEVQVATCPGIPRISN